MSDELKEVWIIDFARNRAGRVIHYTRDGKETLCGLKQLSINGNTRQASRSANFAGTWQLE